MYNPTETIELANSNVGSRSKAGFDVNPQNINREGGIPKELTYAEMIREVGEQKSRYDAMKTRKTVAVEKQWEKAEAGELPSLNFLVDRQEGKAKQADGDLGSAENPIFIVKKMS